MRLNSAVTSRAISRWIASALFFLRRERLLHWPGAADLFIDFEQFATQFPETMKGFDFALRLAQLRRRGEGLTDCLTLDFSRQPEVGSVARLVGLMAAAFRFTAAAADGGDGTAAKIP
jgi:hypothetical protein